MSTREIDRSCQSLCSVSFRCSGCCTSVDWAILPDALPGLVVPPPMPRVVQVREAPEVTVQLLTLSRICLARCLVVIQGRAGNTKHTANAASGRGWQRRSHSSDICRHEGWPLTASLILSTSITSSSTLCLRRLILRSLCASSSKGRLCRAFSAPDRNGVPQSRHGQVVLAPSLCDGGITTEKFKNQCSPALGPPPLLGFVVLSRHRSFLSHVDRLTVVYLSRGAIYSGTLPQVDSSPPSRAQSRLGDGCAPSCSDHAHPQR